MEEIKVKKIILISLVILLASFAYADIKIDDIKVYVEDKIQTADKDGGTIEIRKSDILEITVDLDNNENNITEAKIEGTIDDIDDGDDLKKIINWYEIEANDDKIKTISFVIPNSAEYKSYNMDLKIWYKYKNGTEGNWVIDYDVDIEQRTEDQIDVEKSFQNMTYMFGEMIGTINGCFGYINNSAMCYDELSTVKEERGTYESNWENCDGDLIQKKKEYDSMVTEKDTCENNLKNKEAQYNNLQETTVSKSVCEQQKTEAEKKGNDKAMQNAGLIGVAIGLFFLFQYQKKKKASIGDELYYSKN